MTNHLVNVMKTVDTPSDMILDDKMRDTALRYCRLTLQLVFFTGRQEADLSELVTEGLLHPEENDRLSKVPLSCRSDVVCAWFDMLLRNMKLHEQCAESVSMGMYCG